MNHSEPIRLLETPRSLSEYKLICYKIMLLQPVVGRGGMSVTVPAGATVTVAGATPLVPVSSSVAIASGPLPAQFIATGLKSGNPTLQPAPGTPLTLLQVMQKKHGFSFECFSLLFNLIWLHFQKLTLITIMISIILRELKVIIITIIIKILESDWSSAALI